MTDLGKQIIDNTQKFFIELENDQNHRFHSWEHCYAEFQTARKVEVADIDSLSLHLAFYLASWGMYRGSSFLLWKDYKVHTDAVKLILDKKYDVLAGISCSMLSYDANIELLFDLAERLEEYYGRIKSTTDHTRNKDRSVSETLVTKILMGTLGCVPAYDRFFIGGLKANGIAPHFGRKSVRALCDFYWDNSNGFDGLITEMSQKSGIIYPQMKLLDMGFWQIGFDKDQK